MYIYLLEGVTYNKLKKFLNNPTKLYLRIFIMVNYTETILQLRL